MENIIILKHGSLSIQTEKLLNLIIYKNFAKKTIYNKVIWLRLIKEKEYNIKVGKNIFNEPQQNNRVSKKDKSISRKG
jgi:hypothetical protein